MKSANIRGKNHAGDCYFNIGILYLPSTKKLSSSSIVRSSILPDFPVSFLRSLSWKCLSDCEAFELWSKKWMVRPSFLWLALMPGHLPQWTCRRPALWWLPWTGWRSGSSADTLGRPTSWTWERWGSPFGVTPLQGGCGCCPGSRQAQGRYPHSNSWPQST